MTDLLFIGGGVGVALLIVCLVVREQTEGRIRGLRTEIMSLRSKEKRLADRRDETEKMESQMREAMMRTERCQYELEEASKRYRTHLDHLHLTLRGEAMPGTEAETEEQTENSPT